MKNTTTGGWTPFTTEVSQEAMNAFKIAFEGFVGVIYEPLAVANQVVNGINYSFFCNSQGVFPGAMKQAAMVDIYQAPGEKAIITKISILDH